MKQDNMAIPTSPTTQTHGKPMLHGSSSSLPPPPPPMTYPPNSPAHHVITRHPGGSYSSPRARHHHGAFGMMTAPLSPYGGGGYRSVPVSPVAGSRAAMMMPLDGPPEPSQQKRAMEAAIMAERTRAQQCEKDEAQLTADELRAVLKKERRRTAKMAADLAASKCAAVQQQQQSEIFEEGRINVLMRRVDNLQHEKEKIIVALEREEEMLTNNLQRKLDDVRQEKSKLEQQINVEKSANSKLRSQLSDMRNSQMETAQNLEVQDEMEEE